MLKVHCNCKKNIKQSLGCVAGEKKLRGIVVIPMRLKKPCSSRIWHHHSHAMPKKPTRFQWFILQMWPKVDWQLQPFLHSNPQAKIKRRGHFPLYSYSQSANTWPSHAYTLIPKKKHILSKMIRFLICHDILFHTHTATLTFHTNPLPPPLAANDKSRTLLSISCYYHYCYITTHLVFFLYKKRWKYWGKFCR